MRETANRKKFRFSLKALLFIMTLIAASIGAYIVGYDRGYKTANAESKADYVIWKSPTQ
jgi:hypothetical protein